MLDTQYTRADVHRPAFDLLQRFVSSFLDRCSEFPFAIQCSPDYHIGLIYHRKGSHQEIRQEGIVYRLFYTAHRPKLLQSNHGWWLMDPERRMVWFCFNACRLELCVCWGSSESIMLLILVDQVHLHLSFSSNRIIFATMFGEMDFWIKTEIVCVCMRFYETLSGSISHFNALDAMKTLST